MEEIKQKLSVTNEALETLQKSITLFQKYEHTFENAPSQENEDLFLGMRDSMIQRFEYCTDLLWKLLKVYLESVEKVDLQISSPRGIIREAVKIRIITEQEGNNCMAMIESRNQTSHIYKEEIAQHIATEIPQFYKLMRTIVDKVQLKITKI